MLGNRRGQNLAGLIVLDCSIGAELHSNYNKIILQYVSDAYFMRSLTVRENRTARLTILIDPEKKKLFEEICAAQDLTPSQVVRKLIRRFVQENAGGRVLPSWMETGASD